MAEAILLVGGQGTRLRPLTISTPKPMLPVAGHPCTSHQIARAGEAGITHIVLGTSYKAEVFEDYFAKNDLGVAISYAVETEPLGTGGAIRNAAEKLTCGPDEPVVIFNGDILTGLDIEGLIAKWRAANADVAIYLTRVEDPRAYGLVPTDANGRVQAFTEKPTTPEEIVTDQINAGCYIFKRSIIDQIPAGRVVSVERETFPQLLATDAVVIGVVDDGYWLDLGTPLAFAKGSADLVQGTAPTPLVKNPGATLVESSATIADTAHLTHGTYVGHNASIGNKAVVTSSVIYDGAQIHDNAVVENSIIGANTVIGAGTVVRDAVVSENVTVGPGNELVNGVRVFPGTSISETTVRFSSDK